MLIPGAGSSLLGVSTGSYRGEGEAKVFERGVPCLSDLGSCGDLQAGEGQGCGVREQIYSKLCLAINSTRPGL